MEAQRVIAPYITAWSAEQEVPSRVVERLGLGVGYADEGVGDRDKHGVLWQRAAVRRGVGRPEFGRVHPLRQRRAMRLLLCQVCAGPADRNDDGVVWLLRDYRDDWPGWPGGMACTEPPVCVPCVAVSLRLCPALRRGAVAVRVRECEIAGVRGTLYEKGTSSLVAAEGVNLAYDEPDIRRVVATALIRELRRCTVVPLPQLAGRDGVARTR
ncbi:hypothetical protein [Nocardia sp. NRRL S-836]|uniref:hypothetical protein n=1 Tax=Nocardia sp. NRRL S-836 TaxID=1519492 RepID=UPI0006C10C26|nr:hypothetical protein [Nocardia sp. NRRL S-836]KOV87944.1 hypothetical protein ADL03_06215 [Nocardia sp. NRRL S-836]